MTEPPLVIDLDGTLLRSDLLLESGLAVVRDQPAQMFSAFAWFLDGKPRLKRGLAELSQIDVAVLPYDKEVIEIIVAAKSSNRKIVLATASHKLLADRVADHLGYFDEVIATDGENNLAGGNKKDALIARYGAQGFDYVGNSSDDLHVWRVARKAIVANASSQLQRKVEKLGNFAGAIGSARASLRDWLRALRLHQWLKNLLLFVPLITAHRYLEWSLWLDGALAFVCFGLCASSVYVLNDLLDLRDDRHHPRKRARPFASGQVSIFAGLFALPLLLLAAFAIAQLFLPSIFLVGLASYYLLTLAYSMSLKRHMVIDVITLAALYTLRIIVGALAFNIPLSFWLLAFSMFIFLSLALVKRYTELFHMRLANRTEKVRGRGYFAEDLPMLGAMGAASGYIAVMVLALYINDGRTAQYYRHQEVIWLACPLLLTWVSRIWMLAHRGLVDEDPIIFALRDRVSALIAVSIGVVFWAAT